ncbi:hypothetical protein [Burkholderia gladioli]|uniref:Uncharacterized protein n=1 Tax=Burkholderia gladioli (strain BSR3) TaxID=999541 RepID=F2LSU3_BURGS|nr:hypothetical protein [Burkholderia gladioli]AEA65963.1 hypothetical protein bgla_4p1920 [Burkholderia gladioli BSR3]MBW5286936.1 hypothetical protein [Burkholderia gladioli]
MTEPPTTLAALAAATPHEHLDFAGHRWFAMRSRTRTELRGIASGAMARVTITESLGVSADEAPAYSARVDYQHCHELFVRQSGFSSAEDAVAWASGFAWTTRQVGSVTWTAAAPDADTWYAPIGASQAQIAIYRGREGEAPYYTVTRNLALGAQSVELKVGDRTRGHETRGIVSFEQASAIAVSMTDYVLELMRTVPAAGASGA